jgi:hypothetical protein
VTRDLPIDFRAFLERHAELFRALPAWTLRLLVPRHLAEAIPAYAEAFREQFATLSFANSTGVRNQSRTCGSRRPNEAVSVFRRH